MYARPHFTSDEPFSFGVSGKLWRDSLVMYDHQTRTLWSQINGKAMAGPTQDLVLESLASTVTTWSAWLARHPETLVLVKPKLKRSIYEPYHDNPHRMGIAVARKGDTRLAPKELVFGLKQGEHTLAVPLDRHQTETVRHTRLGEMFLVLVNTGHKAEILAFSREVQGRNLTFERMKRGRDGVTLRDQQTLSLWDGLQGICIEGELKGIELQAVPGTPVYWSIWSRYYPNTEIFPLP